MPDYLLFDLDNTLYSSRYGLENNVKRRIQEFSSGFLGLPPEEAWRQWKERAPLYGTNMEWLMAEKGFCDPEAYLSAVHPPDEAESLPPDPRRRSFLESIPIPKAIITNSPMEHADLILGKLGFENLFTHVFDIRFCNYTGKPHPMVFYKVLETLGVSVETILFIDDVPRYVEGFLALGGKGLLLDETDHWSGYPHPRIRRLEELTDYLA